VTLHPDRALVALRRVLAAEDAALLGGGGLADAAELNPCAERAADLRREVLRLDVAVDDALVLLLDVEHDRLTVHARGDDEPAAHVAIAGRRCSPRTASPTTRCHSGDDRNIAAAADECRAAFDDLHARDAVTAIARI
jgi:hypothetical protein